MLLSAIVRAQIDPLVIVDRFSEESRERWDADRTTSQETHPAEYLYVRDLADLFLGLSRIAENAGSRSPKMSVVPGAWVGFCDGT